MSMKCPRCDVELKATDFGEVGFVVLDICPKCKGTWFDEGELDALDDSVATSAEELEFETVTDEHEPPPCPSCGEALMAVSPPDEPMLVIDRCTSCKGFWLDEGELEHVRDALLHSDSMDNKNGEVYVRPRDWSWARWAVYRFKKCYVG